MTELEEAKKRLLYFTVTCIGVGDEKRKQEFTDIINDLMNVIESHAKIEVLNEFKKP